MSQLFIVQLLDKWEKQKKTFTDMFSHATYENKPQAAHTVSVTLTISFVDTVKFNLRSVTLCILC